MTSTTLDPQTPDARTIAVVTEDHAIVLYDRVQGTTERIAEHASDPSISDDGRSITFSDDRGITIYDRETRTRTTALEDASSPRLSSRAVLSRARPTM